MEDSDEELLRIRMQVEVVAMNLLLFTNLYPSVSEPTRGLFNLNRFRALADRCHMRAIVPVPAWKRIRCPVDLFRPIADSRGGIHASYPTNWALPRVAPQWHAQAMYQSVRSHVRNVRRDFPFDAIVGVFAYPDVAVAARVARDASCPLIAIVTGSDMNELAQRPPLRGQIRGALQQASSIIAVSRGLRDKVLELGLAAEKIVVQHNGVDGARFVVRNRQEARERLGVSETVPLVCFVGNLVFEKGPDILVDAFGGIAAAGLRSGRLVFIGDGPMRKMLTTRAAALGVGERVSFLGRLPPDDVALWLSASNVLCLPSRREGCPNVVLEGLASGRPVVASAVGGVPELLSDRNGVIVAPDDSAALGAALMCAMQRSWDPDDLRASVPSLTWDDFSRTIYDEAATALGKRGSAILSC